MGRLVLRPLWLLAAQFLDRVPQGGRLVLGKNLANLALFVDEDDEGIGTVGGWARIPKVEGASWIQENRQGGPGLLNVGERPIEGVLGVHQPNRDFRRIEMVCDTCLKVWNLQTASGSEQGKIVENHHFAAFVGKVEPSWRRIWPNEPVQHHRRV